MQIMFALLFVHVTGSYHTGQMYLNRYREGVCVCVYLWHIQPHKHVITGFSESPAWKNNLVCLKL